MMLAVMTTFASAMGWVDLGLGHIQLAIPTFLYCIFAQAFVMFYFIGVSRLTNNVWNALHSEQAPQELFEVAPPELAPYLKKTRKFVQHSTRYKRQTIPWTMLMLTLGMLAFFLGAAHDTGGAKKATHVGVVYGFLAASGLGFLRQWHYLGEAHRLLRKLKALFRLPDSRM